MRIYVAGPMRRHEQYNFPAFDAAADKLREAGYKVVNPADLDRESGFHPEELPDDWDWSEYPPGTDASEFVERDLDALATCDAIFMLSGWEGSQGAQAELAVAKWRGLTVMYERGEGEASEKPDRKHVPIQSGCYDYFPDALAAVAYCSWVSNEQHNPGEPMHWAKEKSNDHLDCLSRHTRERGTLDNDNLWHDFKMAWRALAHLQTMLDQHPERKVL